MKSSRRTFLAAGVGLASSLALTGQVLAEAAKVDENDPMAQALGYKHDATLVDKAKQTKYVAGEDCGNCQLFQGKAGEQWGPCPIFSQKLVSVKGWCSAYAKKA
ncbi:MAG: high-potential iron-sulfur protein [Paralcaligenes sp.]